MDLNFSVVVTLLKIVIFLGLGIFMLVIGDRLDIEPIFRIIWGVLLLFFGVYRSYWLYKQLQVKEAGEQDEQVESVE